MMIRCKFCCRHVQKSWARSTALLHTSIPRLEATRFLMPAMSPTMTEGNITSWKMKEGESYSAGDVILEIETDKATMDVEAQDDGILAKILVQDGKKGVAVGTHIAVMAEPGDDINTMELPAEESDESQTNKSSEHAKEKEVRTQKPSEFKPVDSSQGKSGQEPVAKPQTNKDGSSLSPAVQFLLAQHGITDAHAVPATGPRGRLLKGDILTFAKQINKGSTKAIADAYLLRSKLDLSNIKKAPQSSRVKEAKAEPQIEKNPVIEIRQQLDLNHLILLSERISEESGVEVSVEQLAAKAAEKALLDVPMFAVSAKNAYDTIFDELITGSKQDIVRTLAPLPPQRKSDITLSAAEYFQGGDIRLPARAPASTLLTLQAATPAVPHTSQASNDFDLIDFLTDRPRPTPTSTGTFGTSTSPSSMIASLSFKQDSVHVGTATIYLDRLTQYVESPAHLFL